MHFKEKILDCENFISDQDCIYKKGTKKIILTYVHSMVHYKETGIKPRESFTKGISKYVAENSDSFYYIKLEQNNID